MRVRAAIQRFHGFAVFALTIFIAPLTITLLADIVIQLTKSSTVPVWQWLVTAVLILPFVLLVLAGYTDKLDEVGLRVERFLRSRRFRQPRVLILDGRLGERHEIPPSPVISDYTPEEWFRLLGAQAPGWQIEMGPVDRMRNPQVVQIVVNPFGETYPEEDGYAYTTFSRICQFVESGGVYVNVAGIPFFYYHNPRDFSAARQTVRAGRIRVEAGQNGGQQVTQEPLFETLFPQVSDGPDEALVQCAQSDEERANFGGIVDAGGDSRAMMFRAFEVGTPGMMPLLLTHEPPKWLIGSIAYGDGFFLLAGLALRRDAGTSLPKVIAAIKAWAAYESRGRP